MTDRKPGAPGRWKATVTVEDAANISKGEPFNITLERNDDPITPGTPYNKASVLPDDLAAKLCPGVPDPAPKDAFEGLYNLATSKSWELTAALESWAGDDAAGYTQTVAVPGMTAAVQLAGYLLPVLTGGEELEQKKAIQAAMGCISELSTGDGSVTLTCYDAKPEQALTLIVTEVR